MEKHWFMVFLFLCVFAGADEDAAGGTVDEPILVIGPFLDGRMDNDPQSGYRLLADTLFPEDDNRFRFQLLPMARAVQNFATMDRVCMIPASPKMLVLLAGVKMEDLLPSDYIDIVSAHFFFRPSDTIDHDVFQNPKKLLAKQRGLNLLSVKGDTLKAEVVHVPSMVMALKMLNAKRVDAIYAWYPDIMVTSERYQLELPIFDLNSPDITARTAVTCKRFDQAETIIERISRQLQKMKKDGSLQGMLGTYARLAE